MPNTWPAWNLLISKLNLSLYTVKYSVKRYHQLKCNNINLLFLTAILDRDGNELYFTAAYIPGWEDGMTHTFISFVFDDFEFEFFFLPEVNVDDA